MAKGRKPKFTVEEFFDAIVEYLERNEEGNEFTVPDLAEELEICSATARKYIAQLQELGFYLVPCRSGYHLATGTEEDIKALIDAIKRMAGIIKSAGRVSGVVADVKAFPEVTGGLRRMSLEDRGSVRKGLMLIGSLINAIELTDGLDGDAA